MSSQARAKFLMDTVLNNPWIPHEPTERQAEFLSLGCEDALYGGAAGGGKSDALLMAALQFVEMPKYSAILFRRTYKDLSMEGALMSRATEWLGATAARWNQTEKAWTFPSGAVLAFGHLEHEKHKFNYQGGEFQFVGFDEQTQFQETQHSYLYSRLRRLAESPIPVRMRGATNPGGVGHHWVHKKYVVGDVPFVPAKLDDNPHLDRAEYRRFLAKLDPVTRRQLEDGEWVEDTRDKIFLRDWWDGQNRYDATDRAFKTRCTGRILSIDTAFEDTETAAKTACLSFDMTPEYQAALRSVATGKFQFPGLMRFVTDQIKRANRDGKLSAVVIEHKASGICLNQTIGDALPTQLANLIVRYTPKGSKDERQRAASVWCERGCVLLPHPDDSVPWLFDFEDEFYAQPAGEYRDQSDAFAQGVDYLRNLLQAGWRKRQELN